MGGYFLVHESSIDDLDNFDEDDIDGIVDAMEWQEKRIGFQNAILKLANTLLEENNNDSFLANPNDEFEFFQSVEKATFDLNNTMKAYDKGIDLQRIYLLNYIEDFRNLIRAHNNCSSTNSSSKNELVQSLFLAQVLSDQYRRQLDSEYLIILDMMKFITDNLYRNYEDYLLEEQSNIDGFNNSELFFPHNSTNTTPNKTNERKLLLLNDWISALKERRMMERKIWLTKSRRLLKSISRYIQYESKNTSSAYNIDSCKKFEVNISVDENDIIHSKKIPYDLSSLNDKVSSCKTVHEVVDHFVQHENFPHSFEPFHSKEETICRDVNKNYCNQTTIHTSFFLIIGSPGTGKTHFIDTLYQRIIGSVCKIPKKDMNEIQVVRPRLPVDILRSTVGSSEDLLISLFNYAKYSALKKGKCLILLDDLEHIVGYHDSELPSNLRNSNPRSLLQSLFTGIMDELKQDSITKSTIGTFQTANVMVICTGKRFNNDLIQRFDKVFTFGKLNNTDCKQLIHDCFSKSSHNDKERPNQYQNTTITSSQDQFIDELLQEIVKCTAGRSIGEISQFCRSVIASESNEFHVSLENKKSLFKSRLEKLKNLIHETDPESIKNGNISEVVDMTILTSKQLLSNPSYINETGTKTNTNKLPLIGQNAESSWKELENLIIVPLCRSNELNELLFGGRSRGADINGSSPNIRSSKTVCAGVLLTGKPGCGKTALAYHCAAVAASMNPSIRLLDVSCTSLVKKEVGGSEKAVRSLFEAARAAAPCIMLLDGIENIAPVRGNDNTTEGTMDRLLSTILTEMDGLDVYSGDSNTARNKEESIAVIGITHNPDWIDHALRRPGRLEKCITLELPDLKSREKIILQKIESNEIDFSDAQFFDPKNKEELASALAIRTHGSSAADLIALCIDAVMLSVAKKLQKEDFGSDKDWTEQKHSGLPKLSFKDFFSSIKSLRVT